MSQNNPFFLYLYTFIILLLSIQSQTTINYDANSGFTENNYTNIDTSADYKLYFQKKEDIPNYLKVTLTPNLGEETPRLCYSPNSLSCITDRRIISERVDKKPLIAFVKSDEVNKDLRLIYFTITCKQKGCGYTLRFEGDTTCKINNPTVYSFIATKDTISGMDFELIGEADDNTDINIAIEGSNSATIVLKDTSIRIQPLFFDKGKIYTYKLNKICNESCSLSIFTLSGAKEGEYIRLNVHTVYNKNAPDNLLYPGGPTVVGIAHNEGIGGPEECFPISAFEDEEFSTVTYFYLTGKIYSKYALFWMRNEKEELIDSTETKITDGYLAFLVEPYGKKRFICFGFLYDTDIKQRNAIFSISIIPMAGRNTPDFYFMPPPQETGLTMRRMLSKEKSVIYHSTLLDANYERFSFHVFNIKGVVQLHVIKCNTFPECKYDMSEGSDDLKKMELVQNFGKILLYDKPIEKTEGALDKEKTVMVVTCLDDDDKEKGYCEFDTSFNTLKQTITLVENENFAKFAIKDETGSFLIDFKGGFKLMSVSVEIMIHSGEVLFSDSMISEKAPKLKEAPNIKKYILSNKVLMTFDLYDYYFENLLVFYQAMKNSFFTIKYNYDLSGKQSQFKDDIVYPGESYLVQIDPKVINNYKNVHLLNYKYKSNQIYLTNFFALNCDFKVFTNKSQTSETEIKFADGYAQDTISSNEGKIYKNDYYDYKITIEKNEMSNYENKMCLLYVAGFQKKDLNTPPRLIVGNNVNQQFIFVDDIISIQFLYPLADNDKDLVVYANIIDKANYVIKIFANEEKNNIMEKEITFSMPFYIKSEQYDNYCKNDTFCNIVIEMDFVSTFKDLPKTNPMIEITVREATKINDTLRVPTYLQKGIAKKDFTTGDSYYYFYTDIGQNDEGDVTVNFFRDFGEVYGRILPKKTDKQEPDHEWLNTYRLPSFKYIEDSFSYNPYLKKYIIKSEDTAYCVEGCYLILGIIISQIGEWAEEWKFYPFSILARISPNNKEEPQKVIIQVDEFIIGNVEVSKNNKKISQVYEVWLPRDTSELQFDWQSELAGLYINIDGTIPTSEEADFKFISKGIDNTIILEKSQIIEKAKEKRMKLPEGNTLEDWNFVIGIWTDKTDAIDNELYSLRVHENNLEHYDLDIIEVNTDQKILCKPNFIGDNQYSCLFMIIYDEQDILQNMDLLVYSKSNNKADTIEISANFISQNLYHEFNIEELRNNIPSYQNAQYDSIRDDFNYLYIKLNEEKKGKYLYVNIISYSSDDIMIVASINSYENIEKGKQLFYPSARTEQLIQVKEENLIIEFFSKTSLVVNIENLGGEADIRWEEDEKAFYNIRNKGKSLTLTTSNVYKKLIIKKINSDNKTKEGLDPGFVFLLSYHSRDNNTNFEQVSFGNNNEIAYLNTSLPIILFSKSIDYSTDINLAITFKDNIIDKEGYYKSSPLLIKAALDKRDIIYSLKLNPEFEPIPEHCINGYYDPAIKTAQVFMQSKILKNFNISEKDFPTLYLYIGRKNKSEEIINNNFNIQAQFTRMNNLVIPNENIFYYGKYYGIVTQYYKLKTDKKKELMKIILSFNSKELLWSIGQQSAHSNSTDLNINAIEERGKIMITIKPGEKDFIFLNIFKNSTEEKEELQNYVFKYINIAKDSEFIDYKILNNNGSINYIEEKEKITCSFNKINIPQNEEVNITYFFKIINAKDYIENESIKTIALTQSPYISTYKRNPTNDNNGKITLSINEDFPQWTYLQVIAQIQHYGVIDYVAYEGIYKERKINPDNSDDKNDSNNNTALFIGLSVSLLIVIIVLVIVAIYFRRKNNSLMNQVKHVSFQKSESDNPDFLLAKDK